MASLFSIVQNQVPPPNIPTPMPQAEYTQPQAPTAQIPQAVLQQVQAQQAAAPPLAPQAPQAAAPGFNAGGLYNIPGYAGGEEDVQYDALGGVIGGGSGGGGPIGAGDPGFSYYQQATAPTYTDGQTGRVDLPAQLAFWNQLPEDRKAYFANLEVGLKATGSGSSADRDYTFDYAKLAQDAAENQLTRDQQLMIANNQIAGQQKIADMQNLFNQVQLQQQHDVAVQDSVDKQRQIAESAAAQAQNFFSANVGYAGAEAFNDYNPVTGATPEARSFHPKETTINPSFIMGVGGSSAAGPNIPAPVFTR